MNPLYAIIAQYGIEFTIELVKLIEAKNIPTADDFEQLKVKYGTKNAQQYLDEAKAKTAIATLGQ